MNVVSEKVIHENNEVRKVNFHGGNQEHLFMHCVQKNVRQYPKKLKLIKGIIILVSKMEVVRISVNVLFSDSQSTKNREKGLQIIKKLYIGLQYVKLE